ncbi:MAG: hypothetical protein JNN04_08755 [Cyclobacteriaceae bacterium]|nr:hypothetical protein [Cyclobacteriaceae bacterium]
MYSRSWQIIRDDTKKTFEVQGQESNTDHFLNLVHGMQRQGMTVSAVILPVTNRHASKESIEFTGYRRDEGLYARLMKEYQQKMRGDEAFWEEDV